MEKETRDFILFGITIIVVWAVIIDYTSYSEAEQSEATKTEEKKL